MGHRICVVASLAAALLATAPVFAHHSFQAEFDIGKPMTIKGTVSKVEWVNPHVYVHVDVKDEKGGVTRWAFETLGPGRMGPPAQIVQLPDKLVFLYATNLFRLVPINASHRTDIDTSYMGDSVAKWDGDTLVVDVNNLNDDTWLGPDGYFHTEAMHVVERFTRSGDTLKYEVTVEDPNVFTRPWNMARYVLPVPAGPTPNTMSN